MQFFTLTRKYILNRLPKTDSSKVTEDCGPYTLVRPDFSEQNFSNEPSVKNPLLEEPSLKVFCDSCKKEITHSVYSVFGNQQFCIKCFSNLEVYDRHYEIIQKLNFPVLQLSWSAYQQILLLTSLQKYGFDNWKEIQQNMELFGSKFSQNEIQTHYNTFYFADKTFLPVTFDFIQRFLPKSVDQTKETLKEKLNQGSTASLTPKAMSDSFNPTLEEVDGFSNEASDQLLHDCLKSFNCKQLQKIVGFNSRRKQFNINFDESAQKALANLQFRDDDLPEEREVKFKMIQEYNQKLKRRCEVESFILEHGLLDLQQPKPLSRELTPYYQEAADQLKKFMRFSSHEQHSQLIKRFALEKEIKSIIQGLRRFIRISNAGQLEQMMQKLGKQTLEHSKAPVKRRNRSQKTLPKKNIENMKGIKKKSKKKKNAKKVVRREDEMKK